LSDVSAVTEPLALGIVGCGGIFTERLHPSLHGLPVRLAAVCDLDGERANAYAARFDVKRVYTDHLAMLGEARLDAVIVCAGPAGHPRVAIDAMEAGLPVLAEKPPSVTAAEAAAMAEVSRKTGKLCMIAFNKRFSPVYRKAQAIVDQADFGPQSLLSIDWCSPPWYAEEEGRPMTSFLLDFGIHIVDLARFLYGEVDEVYARRLGESAYAVCLSFASGAVGTLSLSSHHTARLTERVQLTGKVGEVLTIEDGRKLLRYRNEAIADWHDTAHAISDSFEETGYRGELAEFVNAVKEGRDPASSVRSAHQSMRLYEAIVLSGRERRAVSLAEIG
jgi:myo-inositol 2-dehydrogenase / D-chiro-inositol 1-dehydrogenase